jgi:hypothetical protein
MPALSKPHSPYSGRAFVGVVATAGVDAGIDSAVVGDDGVGLGVVEVGAGFDPHAAMNRVAARSFDFMREVLTRVHPAG